MIIFSQLFFINSGGAYEFEEAFVAVFIIDRVDMCVKGNVVFKVQHKFGGRGKGVEALRALKAHDSGRHGRLLSAVDFQLGGNGKPTDAAYIS